MTISYPLDYKQDLYYTNYTLDETGKIFSINTRDLILYKHFSIIVYLGFIPYYKSFRDGIDIVSEKTGKTVRFDYFSKSHINDIVYFDNKVYTDILIEIDTNNTKDIFNSILLRAGGMVISPVS